MAKLLLLLDDVVINEYSLDKKRITIGREASSDILVDDPVVSSQHAVITINKNAYMPETLDVFFNDLKSTNGSRINKLRPKERQKLKNGDIIEIGRSVYRYDDGQNAPIDATAIFLPDDMPDEDDK